MMDKRVKIVSVRLSDDEYRQVISNDPTNEGRASLGIRQLIKEQMELDKWQAKKLKAYKNKGAKK